MSLRKAAALLAASLLFTWGAAAQQPFTLLSPPQPTEGGGKVEVIEFFWYGCPHCYSLEPQVNAWLQKLPKDVVFKRVHATVGNWERHAAIFFTLEAMGLFDQMHQKVFDAIHKQNINLTDKKTRDDWLAKNGVDPAKYADVEKSFSVVTKLQRSRQMTMNYKVDTVPQIIVDGRYKIDNEVATRMGGIFPTVDQLVAAVRREKTAQAAPIPTPAPAPAKK